MFDRALDAKPYRGRRVRLEAEGRAAVDDEWSGAFLVLGAGKGDSRWMLGEGLLVLEWTRDQPWIAGPWESRRVEMDVAVDADALRIGFVLTGNGTASIRNIRLEDSAQ